MEDGDEIDAMLSQVRLGPITAPMTRKPDPNPLLYTGWRKRCHACLWLSLILMIIINLSTF